jgi:hypothetical protein
MNLEYLLEFPAELREARIPLRLLRPLAELLPYDVLAVNQVKCGVAVCKQCWHFRKARFSAACVAGAYPQLELAPRLADLFRTWMFHDVAQRRRPLSMKPAFRRADMGLIERYFDVTGLTRQTNSTPTETVF